MQETYMLTTQTACGLYAAVRNLPIVDYHCHLSPKEIFEDVPFADIGELWLAADHYKWRLMRSAGVGEEFITGNAPWREKFVKYCEALEFAAGNPLYHWSHMELSQFFGIDLPINARNAATLWERANAVIAEKKLSPRRLLAQSNVEMICTTDDPADDLIWHKRLRDEGRLRVLPSFRTDNLLLARQAGYAEYIRRLGQAAETPICDLASLKRAISVRLDAFCALGCRCADVGIPYFPNRIAAEREADGTFRALLAGREVTDAEYMGFLGNLHVSLARLYREKNILSQWHTAVVRNANSVLMKTAGADSGGDCVGNALNGSDLITLLDAINTDCGLPNTVLYSLNEANIAQLASIAGSFPNVRCGAAWWFCDHRRGIEKQLRVIAENGCLGGFYGMLTDSRSFLSYARHDYFRRILCDLIGGWVENGEYDAGSAERLAAKICYYNIKETVGD